MIFNKHSGNEIHKFIVNIGGKYKHYNVGLLTQRQVLRTRIVQFELDFSNRTHYRDKLKPFMFEIILQCNTMCLRVSSSLNGEAKCAILM